MKNRVIDIHNHAFLLIEVLIAVVILSVGIVFTLRSFHHITALSHRSVQFFRSELQAEELLLDARLKLESGYGSGISGKLKNGETTHYAIKKVQLRLDVVDEEESEGQALALDDSVYNVATLSVNSGDALLIDLPIVIRESMKNE